MEGMMAGVMGGLMGGMNGIMFRVDHILYLMPSFMLISVVIMAGLSYLFFEEVVEHNTTLTRANRSFWSFFGYSLLFTILLAALILVGPRTGIAALGGGI